ncbi:hypothetical protein [Vibrio fortis]|uniref:hypothetical protein n=1 Tax=Vibrio fortis TaxID=212667 RepID=UPI001CDA04FB|nr:hypothetical protein [Vibrio fortis]
MRLALVNTHISFTVLLRERSAQRHYSRSKRVRTAFTSEQAIGDEGYLADRGLIPLSARDWKLVRAAGTELTPTYNSCRNHGVPSQ